MYKKNRTSRYFRKKKNWSSREKKNRITFLLPSTRYGVLDHEPKTTEPILGISWWPIMRKILSFHTSNSITQRPSFLSSKRSRAGRILPSMTYQKDWFSRGGYMLAFHRVGSSGPSPVFSSRRVPLCRDGEANSICSRTGRFLW